MNDGSVNVDALKKDELLEKKKKKVSSGRSTPREHPLLIIKNWIDGIVRNAYMKTEYEWSPSIFHWIWYCAVYGMLFTFGLISYLAYGILWLVLVGGPPAAVFIFASEHQYVAAVGSFLFGVIIWTIMARLDMWSGDWATRSRW